ncbi:uncharacterized protein LOC105394547 [Plutella xylostella]|uniref:uncharacterized protein LOC105394547 n=1 Tax=Plutella xylostella TaxID=51655 RepID=UPI002032BD1E|nr:uncharacterized protein LOC105394547 [Plutella xylostella]
MVACELDGETSAEVLGWRLPPWQALLVHRVLPACGGLVVYLLVMCFDITIVITRFMDGNTGLAVTSLILIVLPALLSLVFTLASPPALLVDDRADSTEQTQTIDCCWVMTQILNLFVFPVAAISRYMYEIFWWTEAVFASLYQDEARTKQAVALARAPSPLELYLFLQAFVHAAPHAIINIVVLMTDTQMDYDSVSLQAISIVASSLRMASTATVYRRFEREKECGRKYPWSYNRAIQDNEANEHIENHNKAAEENIYETILPRNRPAPTPYLNGNRKYNSNLIQFSPSVRGDSGAFFDSASETDSDYLVPIPRSQNIISEANSDDDTGRPKSIIDRVAPRRNTEYTIQDVEIMPPPAMPAPRLTLSDWAEKMVENMESIPDWLSAPPRYKTNHYEVVRDEPDIPRRVSRRFVTGLEPQDAAASLVHFLGWYMFFISRLLSISAFIVFHPIAAIVILFSHYQIMLLLLIVPQASTVRRSFYIFLAFVYLFCLMELKVRFRHVRAWHAGWLVAKSAQTLVFTAVWAAVDNPLSAWWRDYVVLVIFSSLLLSYMCLLVYFVLLKPKETIVYIDEGKKFRA